MSELKDLVDIVVIETVNMQCSCSPLERDDGHLIDCNMPQLGDAVNNLYNFVCDMEQDNRHTGWVIVETKLPDYDEEVIWLAECGNMCIDSIDKDDDIERFISYGFNRRFTHWMPLPQPPKAKEE